MMCIGYVPCAKGGISPKRYANVNRPTPTLFNPTPMFATRTSTLATLELVSTLPHSVSPDPTSVEFISTSTICGGASGGRIGTTMCGLCGTGDGDGADVGDAVVGSAGADVTVASATTCERTGRRFFRKGVVVAGAAVGTAVATVSDTGWSTCAAGCEAQAARPRASRATTKTGW